MDKLLTLKEASKVLRVSYSTAQKMAKRGDYPFRKIGAAWKIPRSELYLRLGLEAEEKD